MCSSYTYALRFISSVRLRDFPTTQKLIQSKRRGFTPRLILFYLRLTYNPYRTCDKFCEEFFDPLFLFLPLDTAEEQRHRTRARMRTDHAADFAHEKFPFSEPRF